MTTLPKIEAAADALPPQQKQELLLFLAARLHADVMQLSAPLWAQCPAVESVPGKVSGAWVPKGTRMPVSAIFENLEAGASIDDLVQWFDGLDREQIKAVIEFAARSLDRAPAHT
jgi:uncharacterized protein (DUF433 family)